MSSEEKIPGGENMSEVPGEPEGILQVLERLEDFFDYKVDQVYHTFVSNLILLMKKNIFK
jgi:hypothetical protein